MYGRTPTGMPTSITTVEMREMEDRLYHQAFATVNQKGPNGYLLPWLQDAADLLRKIRDEWVNVPEVGMPVTINYINDRVAGEIIGMTESGKTLYVGGPFRNDEDRKKAQSDPKQHGRAFRLNGEGRYKEGGCRGCSLTLGVAEDYRAPEI